MNALRATASAAGSYTVIATISDTNYSGTATGTFAWTTSSTMPSAGTALYGVTFTPTDTANYTVVSNSVSVTVSKATPAITWATPAAITHGAALSSTQLNATANVAGSFAYIPAAGAILSAGTNTFLVTFTPTDATN
jgi:hypothetical protein